MSGVDAEISVVFIGKKGRTPPLKLRKSRKSPDGRPEVNTYYLDCDDDVDLFGAVEIVNEGEGIFAGWEVQKIVVDKIIEGGLQSINYWARYVFPCYGWVKPNNIRCFFEGTARFTSSAAAAAPRKSFSRVFTGRPPARARRRGRRRAT